MSEAAGKKKKKRIVGTRDLILDEAERLIGRNGYDALRLRDIAEPLGIRVPSIYSHFDGRDAVCAAVAQRYVDILAEQFPDDGKSDPVETLLAGVRSFVHVLAGNPAYTRLGLRDLEAPNGLPGLNLASGGRAAENLTEGPLAPLYDRLRGLLDRGNRADVFRKVDFVHFWRTIVGTTMMSLTWPYQDLIGDDPRHAEIAQVMAEVEALTVLFLGIKR